MKRIWFNRWFSQLYNMVGGIKAKHPGEFHFVISHSNSNSLNLRIGDEVFVEDVFESNDESYVDYCLQKCKEYKVDAFVPYLNASLISKNISKFDEIGVKVMLFSDFDKLSIINNKVDFYSLLKDKGIGNIPKHTVINKEHNIQEAVEYFKEVYEGVNVCIKPTSGVGGNGFHILTNKKYNLSELMDFTFSNKVHIDDFIALCNEHIQNSEEFPEIMMMTYLNEKEISVDVLADKNGNYVSSVIREKVDKYQQRLFNDELVTETVKQISKLMKIPYVFNVQFIYKEGIPYVLELNPRMSGGCFISEFSGIELFYGALCELTDTPYKIKKTYDDILLNRINIIEEKR